MPSSTERAPLTAGGDSGVLPGSFHVAIYRILCLNLRFKLEFCAARAASISFGACASVSIECAAFGIEQRVRSSSLYGSAKRCETVHGVRPYTV